MPDGVEQSSSLSDRMVAAAEQAEKQTTEKFDLPRFWGVLAVELRSLGYRTIRKIQQRNEKVRDPITRELYNMADQLVMATEGFYEVNGESYKEKDDTWVTLAKRMPNSPDSLDPRKAILFLLEGDRHIHFLFGEWVEWSSSVRPGIDEEVAQDFETIQ